jgi:hypothetical protein
MRFGAVATITLFVTAGVLTSIPGCQLIETREDASKSTGGSGSPPTSSGGSNSGGSTTSSGGTVNSGGAISSGGASSKGGAGGTTTTGGEGGSAGEGGTVASGGTIASGGAGAQGGNTTKSGGGGPGGSGGAAGSGGAPPPGGNTARGGAGGGGGTTTTPTSVGSCTDDPPPNQTPTCAEWVSYGMCSQSWFATYCNKSCNRCSGGSQGGAGGSGGSSARGGSGGAAGAGGSGGVSSSGGTTAKGGSGGGGGVSGPGTTNPQITGTNAYATRYWDCCKPSCGWTANSNPPVPACGKDGTTRVGADSKNGCEGGGSAFECYDFSPWYDSGTNMSYGFAAKNGVTCGACFMLQFTGESNSGQNAGAAAMKGQQMVVQAINIGGIAQDQFDLLIPGGGVGAMNGCATQWGSSTDLGAQYGGLLSECNTDPTCMKGKCQSVFGSMPALKAGCDWFTGWFSSADNPKLVYKQVSCPSQLSSKTGLSK